MTSQTAAEMQFVFVPKRGPIDAVFMSKNSIMLNEKLYMSFMDLSKTFNRVPGKVLELAFRKK